MNKAKQILQLIQPFVDNNTILARSYELINKNITEFITIKENGIIVACCGIKQYKNINELYCLAVATNKQKQKLSTRLLQQVENKSFNRQIFALSKYNKSWFLAHGFIQTTINNLPLTVQKKYDYNRAPNIFIKNLINN